MTVVTVQESLLDLADQAAAGPLRPERVPLVHGAWVDVQRGWLARLDAPELVLRTLLRGEGAAHVE